MTDAGRYFDDISEGEELAVLEKQPDLVQVVKWSGATWTFVPIFYDRDLARSHGLPDSLIPGPMKLAYLTLMLRRWAGPNALIRALRTSYRRPDIPRQAITCHGVVTRAAIENGRGGGRSGSLGAELPWRTHGGGRGDARVAVALAARYAYWTVIQPG